MLRVTNRLPENIVVHLHGGHVPVTEDGHAMDYILPGNSRTYLYPNNQPAATIWYHDHAMGITGPHVWKGLFAPYIVTDDFERSLPLPAGANDVPLIIQDRLFNVDGSFNYPTSTMGMQHGVQGDVMLVNGAIQPYFQVATRKYRFRIVNGANARLMQLALNTGQPFVQIGGDGGLLPAAVTRTSLLMSPGERIEAVVDFSGYKIGTQIVLKNTLGSGRTLDVMRFDVIRKETDTAMVPTTLRPIQRFSPAAAMRTRTFTLGMNMSGYTINGLTYDCMRVDAAPTLDSIEIWEFVNPMGMWHCMHTHDIMWQTLDRSGAAPPAWEAGWKDVWYVPGGGRVRIIGKFADYACCPDPMMYLQNYMLHCHILEHDDNGMMAQFKVIDPGM
jgi:FtsP/CotA-like multicopper oxidase with cupredoxin domain